MIARAEEKALMKVIEKMADSLDEKELDTLIEILAKLRFFFLFGLVVRLIQTNKYDNN
jgi:DNA-binding MurR/RpiR family transcriptional regulator